MSHYKNFIILYILICFFFKKLQVKKFEVRKAKSKILITKSLKQTRFLKCFRVSYKEVGKTAFTIYIFYAANRRLKLTTSILIHRPILIRI